MCVRQHMCLFPSPHPSSACSFVEQRTQTGQISLDVRWSIKWGELREQQYRLSNSEQHFTAPLEIKTDRSAFILSWYVESAVCDWGKNDNMLSHYTSLMFFKFFPKVLCCLKAVCVFFFSVSQVLTSSRSSSMITATSVLTGSLDLAFQTSLAGSKTLKLTSVFVCYAYFQMDYFSFPRFISVWVKAEVKANCPHIKLITDASLYCNIVFL